MCFEVLKTCRKNVPITKYEMKRFEVDFEGFSDRFYRNLWQARIEFGTVRTGFMFRKYPPRGRVDSEGNFMYNNTSCVAVIQTELHQNHSNSFYYRDWLWKVLMSRGGGIIIGNITLKESKFPDGRALCSWPPSGSPSTVPLISIAGLGDSTFSCCSSSSVALPASGSVSVNFGDASR